MSSSAKSPPTSKAKSTTLPKFTRVSRSVLSRKCACGGQPGPSGSCSACAKEHEKEKEKAPGLLQKSSNGSGAAASGAVPQAVHGALASPGRSLDSSTRGFMESRFGHDFSSVRVHDDARAAESARAVGARAYTVGQDVVFGAGEYRPGTPEGGHLIAHELAHTVQQAGFRRAASGEVKMAGGLDSRLEHEAEAAAKAVVASKKDDDKAHRPPVLTKPTTPVLSRAPGGPAPQGAEVNDEDARGWTPISPASALGKANLGVTHESKPHTTTKGDTIRAYRLPVFNVPPTKGGSKGTVGALWQARADAGALESIVDIEGTARPRAALKQNRASTEVLRKTWLQKVGWTPQEAPANWASVTKTPAAKEFTPKVGTQTCDMDHIVELQMGGTNVPENIQPLDASENRSSGASIAAFLRSKAAAIRDALQPEAPGLKDVVLHFDSASQASENPNVCTTIEEKAKALAGTAADAEKAIALEPYPIHAGGSDADLKVKAGSKSASIHEDKVNASASELIPGMVLLTLNRGAKGAGDHIDACIESQNCPKSTRKTKTPITFEDAKSKPRLDVTEKPKNVLKLNAASKNKPLKFTYPYLSTGTITHLDYSETTGLSGAGKLRPSIPLLNKVELGVKFSEDTLEVTAGVPKDKFQVPIPGVSITRADVTLELAPEFKPSGTIAFVVGPKAHPYLLTDLTISADAQGFLAKGDLTAKVPGLDETKGTVEYRPSTGWKGTLEVKTSQIPFLKNVDVKAWFSDKGLMLEGGLDVALPQGQDIGVKVFKRGESWIYKGKGEFKVPVLDPVKLDVETDGNKVTGTGETGFHLHGLDGRITVHYRDGRVSGKGKLKVKKGRAEGDIDVNMNEQQKFFGEGTIRYQVTDNLIATAGIVLHEDQKVTLKGALEFPKPIHLFDGFKSEKELFKAGITIPIPGVSIGPVGLVIQIDGALAARIGVGPAELQNAKIAAAFNPLEDNPDPTLDISATLVIPAYAGVSGSIRGAIAVSAKIASISGGLTVIASADLRGGFKAQADIHYEKSRFELKAVAGIEAALALGLKLDADVTAEAGIGPFSVKAQKVWHLAAFEYPTGLKFGLRAPLYYASDQPFKAPGLGDVQFDPVDIKVGDLLERSLKGANAKQDPPE